MTGLTELLVRLVQHVPEVELDHKRNHVSAKVQNKVFAYNRTDDLVLKLPRRRVDELEAAGEASRLVMGKREMAEWAVVQAPAGAGTTALKLLLDESIAFVGAS